MVNNNETVVRNGLDLLSTLCIACSTRNDHTTKKHKTVFLFRKLKLVEELGSPKNVGIPKFKIHGLIYY